MCIQAACCRDCGRMLPSSVGCALRLAPGCRWLLLRSTWSLHRDKPPPSSARLRPVKAPRPSGRSGGEAVPQMSPPLLLLLRSHRDHSERIYLLFSAQLVRSEFTWEPEQLFGFNMASSATGDREEQVSGLKRPRGALTQDSSAGLFLCWLVERESEIYKHRGASLSQSSRLFP